MGFIVSVTSRTPAAPTCGRAQDQALTSADLLIQPNENSFGAADVAEPIAVLVLLQLANEFGAMGAQASENVLNVGDGEHYATDAERVRRCVRLSSGRRRRVELRQLEPAVTAGDLSRRWCLAALAPLLHRSRKR
jgi:hypothetical protein